MPIETFPLHFEGCEHVLRIPLVHNSDDSRCYLCHPELRDRPVTGKCPECICGGGIIIQPWSNIALQPSAALLQIGPALHTLRTC